MPNGEATHVALEYHKALRAEIIERLKLRDHILLAYLGATGALVGFAFEHPDLKPSLLVVLPFLGLGGATMVAQHQDQIVAYNRYITKDLAHYLPAGVEEKVPDFYGSETARDHLKRNLWMNFVSQLIVLCGPPIFAVILNQPHLADGWAMKDTYTVLGLGLTAATAGRLWLSLAFRHKVMAKLPSHHAKRSATAGS